MGTAFQVTVGENAVYDSPLLVMVARFLRNNWIFHLAPRKLDNHSPTSLPPSLSPSILLS